MRSPEKKLWDQRVEVSFQEDAWVNENMAIYYLDRVLGNENYERLAVFDLLASQKTDICKERMKILRIIPAIIPGGCTGLVQPCDTVLNKPFKDHIKAAATRHYDENLERWTEGKFTASERRIIMTKWVGDAWAAVSKDREAIMRGFTKAGIAVAIDGSEDDLINIKGLPNYRPGIDKGKGRQDDHYEVLTEQERAEEMEEEVEELTNEEWTAWRSTEIDDDDSADDTDYE